MKTADKFGLITDENFSHELFSSRNNKIQGENTHNLIINMLRSCGSSKSIKLKIEKIAHKLEVLTRKLLTNGLKYSSRIRVRTLKHGPVL